MSSGATAPLPGLPARKTATGTVLRLCGPPAPAVEDVASGEPRGCCFFVAGTLPEMAQSLETLADNCESDAQRWPQRAFYPLQIASLARFLARRMREGQYP